MKSHLLLILEDLLQIKFGLVIKSIRTYTAATTTERQVLKALDLIVTKRKEQGVVASQNMH